MEASQDLSSSLIRIAESVRSRERHLRAFNSSQQVFQMTVDVFSQVINFCIRAKIHFQKPTMSTEPLKPSKINPPASIADEMLERHIEQGLMPVQGKLDQILKEIDRLSFLLDNEYRLADFEIQEAFRKGQCITGLSVE